MIIWLASYPRSGNTFLRVVLHRHYGVPTYSVYDDDDPVAQRIGPALVGYRPKPVDRTEMVQSPDPFFVKTHKRRKADRHPAICLVRDGRDAVVSHARLRASSAADESHPTFDQILREEITRAFAPEQPSSGTWGGNVLSWLDHGDRPLAVIRYEELIADPGPVVERAVSSLVPELMPKRDAPIPSFDELHSIDAAFFRRGKSQSHRDEMSAELEELFWSQPENAAAMARLGYGSRASIA